MSTWLVGQRGALFSRRWRIVVVGGPDAGRTAALEERTGVLGAAPASVVKLRDDTVSRYHAEVDATAGGLGGRDLDSTNGLFSPDERRVAVTWVGPGQSFRLGQSALRAVAEDEATSLAPKRLGKDATYFGFVANSAPSLQVVDGLAAAAESPGALLLCGEPGSGRRTAALAVAGARGLRVEVIETPTDAEQWSSLDLESEELIYVLRDIDQLEGEAAELAIRIFDTYPTRLWISTATQKPEHPGLASRFASLVVHMPRLAERRDDIPVIARRFVPESLRPLGPKTMALLRSHGWPGHVAELRRAVRRLGSDGADGFGPFSMHLTESFLTELLAQHKGDVSGASRALGRPTWQLFSDLSRHRVELDDL